MNELSDLDSAFITWSHVKSGLSCSLLILPDVHSLTKRPLMGTEVRSKKLADRTDKLSLSVFRLVWVKQE